MTWWDKTFLEKVNEVLKDMNLYLRYVDDEYVVCEEVPETEENRGQERDERTMKKLQEIGNGIHPSIQLTIDFPSNNSNGRMPALDTEHWIEEMEENGVMKPQILHSHYSKPMANDFVIHKSSAVSSRSKENILVADLTRVMRNVSTKCSEQERKGKIQHFISRMQYSGYGMDERIRVYRSAKRRYDEMLRKDSEGGEPMYRSKDWNRSERIKNKRLKKRTWFKNDGSDAVFFVSATPGSSLAEKCKVEFRRAGLKVKVVERSGTSVKKTLVKSNPFKKRGCNRDGCLVCRLDGDVDCKAREVHYKISCKGVDESGEQCSNVNYEGETSRSTGERFPGHMSVLNSNKEQVRQKSFFYDHIMESHNGEIPPLSLEILRRFPGDPALRQATEAVSIRTNKPSLNGKEEWTNEPRKRKPRK